MHVTREGPIATLTLDRPDRRNALDPGLLRALGEAVDGLSSDEDVRVVVLAGAGSAFSAGADIGWMRASRGLPAAENHADAVAMAEAFDTLDRCPKAVVARVHGPAIGGGAGVVACADVAVAAEGARFAFAEVRLGILPASIAPFVLRKIGPGRARELFTTGRAFDAAEAAAYGLVHHVVPADRLDATVDDVARTFLACGPAAVAANKLLVRDATAAYALPDLPDRIAAARASDEGQEGASAFLEKRLPRWSSSEGS
ncbi:MAG: enoyl-CoA hydratase-related protein [Actinomycetota bacterium]